jgi:hypothetical protein
MSLYDIVDWIINMDWIMRIIVILLILYGIVIPLLPIILPIIFGR